MNIFNLQSALDQFQLQNPTKIVVSQISFGDEGDYSYRDFSIIVFDTLHEFYLWFNKLTDNKWTITDNNEDYTKDEAVISLSQRYVSDLTFALYLYKSSGYYITFNNEEVFNTVIRYVRVNIFDIITDDNDEQVEIMNDEQVEIINDEQVDDFFRAMLPMTNHPTINPTPTPYPSPTESVFPDINKFL